MFINIEQSTQIGITKIVYYFDVVKNYISFEHNTNALYTQNYAGNTCQSILALKFGNCCIHFIFYVNQMFTDL